MARAPVGARLPGSDAALASHDFASAIRTGVGDVDAEVVVVV